VADLAAGLAAAMRICAACLHSRATGEGAVLDIAMADVLATWTGPADSKLQGRDTATRGIPGYGTFPTADGQWLALGVLDEDPFWSALCHCLGLDDHAGLGFTDRANRMQELQAAIAEAVARRPRDELVTELLDAGVPVAPVLDRAGMLALEHFRARGVMGER
jgi:crotonobetainyl-CoA:carnitine CoA-transferase CaiB-like acyl-CoA transferase